MKTLFAKPKFYFLAIAPLLLATALFKVECPVCQGHGSVVGSVNMDAVRILTVESRILDSQQDACTGYIVTKAVPYITAFNIGDEDAEGWFVMDLLNLNTDEHLASQYVAVKVAANTTVILDSLVVFAFYSADIPPQHLAIKVEPLVGAVPDTTCNGSGQVNLNAYFLASAFKDRLVAEVKSSVEFGPDLSHGEPGSKEWLAWNELD
ncbi:MAG: hypothetical protein FWH51_04890 [Dehalococcoidia bacterium]|nr:hypothetical protein [Dehalococcoidia bacterium]